VQKVTEEELPQRALKTGRLACPVYRVHILAGIDRLKACLPMLSFI
jgi:hypothetical protein